MHNLISYNQLAYWSQITTSKTEEENELIEDYFECLSECDEDTQTCKRVCRAILTTQTSLETVPRPLTFSVRGLIVSVLNRKTHIMFSAKVTLKYDSIWEQTRGIYDEEMIPEEHITFETPVEDMNTIQLFQFFAKFAGAMGHNEAGIAKGAAYVAFNEMRTTEAMRKTADDYDLVLVKDHCKKLNEYDADQDKDLKKLEAEIRDLKAKLSRYENPDNPNYTEEEMDAMSAEEYNVWNYLIPGDRKSTRLNSSHVSESRMPSSA